MATISIDEFKIVHMMELETTAGMNAWFDLPNKGEVVRNIAQYVLNCLDKFKSGDKCWTCSCGRTDTLSIA